MHYLAKHAPRKRRSIKARFAGIGVAGAATIAAGIATANEAKAAGSIWDTVAQCETGQNWATNSVPGYSGGLGFANRYWAAFGGTQYSALPYQATREQQIAVAQRILATNGPTAWPVCGPRAGLTKANGGAATAAAAPAAAAAPSTSRSTTRTAPKATTTTKKATCHAGGQAREHHAGCLGQHRHRQGRRHAQRARRHARCQGWVEGAVRGQHQPGEEPEPHLRRPGSPPACVT